MCNNGILNAKKTRYSVIIIIFNKQLNKIQSE